MGTLDTLIGDAFGTIFGTGDVMGIAILAFIAYVVFKSGMQLSGIAFIGMLAIGVLVTLGYLNALWWGVFLMMGGYLVWRAFMQVAG